MQPYKRGHGHIYVLPEAKLQQKSILMVFLIIHEQFEILILLLTHTSGQLVHDERLITHDSLMNSAFITAPSPPEKLPSSTTPTSPNSTPANDYSQIFKQVCSTTQHISTQDMPAIF